MRVAAIDIGTNSVLLLVAERRGADIVPLAERATITRLGQGVDATRALNTEAVERTLACLARYGEELKALGAERIEAVGTSAMRDAAGGDEFTNRAASLLGVRPRVISGLEEAELTFHGALSGLPARPGPRVVFDIGGGSTEIISSTAPHEAITAVSLDIGSVRLTERHIHSDPPQQVELDATKADIRAQLASVPRLASSTEPLLVGVAGTVTTVAALVHDVAPYDAQRIHGSQLSYEDIQRTIEQLSSIPVAARRALRALDPARADVIVAGSLIVQEILLWAGHPTGAPARSIIASDRGVRWGIAHKLLQAK
ncbi:Ppx/GppA phosphatase family protein [Chondromyces crocatus]|uniref:Phosphatase n=1 Tax=Chondromyces crocatus TaxID=52 RepID=A0A0K1EN66_CHOCO|nr:Ppx/GppA phosphatase family protein [Chondromyces crocatus]AKT42281.1 phosphatase [Chondromyces crocatus]